MPNDGARYDKCSLALTPCTNCRTCTAVKVMTLEESITRLQAQSASLRATMERWADVMVAKLERRIPSSDPMSMREALGSESRMLPRWKRQPHSFDALPNGETIVIGPRRAHTVRMRRDYNLADCQYLQSVALASYAIAAEEADAILRRSKPNTSSWLTTVSGSSRMIANFERNTFTKRIWSARVKRSRRTSGAFSEATW
jgi:hypothetical protein